MISELMPIFGGAEGHGYTSDMAAHMGFGLQMPNEEGTEFLNGLDTPFWTNNDQWRGMGGAGQ